MVASAVGVECGRAERIGRSLDKLIEALPKARIAIGRVANRQLINRLIGSEGRTWAADVIQFARTAPPVLARRVYDILGALIQLRPRALLQPSLLLRGLLDALGGVFVKISQIVSHASGVLPESLVKVSTTPVANPHQRAA